MSETIFNFSQIPTPNGVLACVHQVLGVSAVMVTLPEETLQRTILYSGPPQPRRFLESLPIRYSICRHVTGMDFELIAEDAYSHPLLKNHPAVLELGVAAYLGVPIKRADGSSGSGFVLCAIDSHQRRWSQDVIDLMHSAARRLFDLRNSFFPENPTKSPNP